MIRTEPIIAVENVEASLLCLHHWGDHDHPSLMSPDQGKVGNGLLLFFRVDNFDGAWGRAQSLAPRIEQEPHLNPLAGHTEFTLRDLDGYYVTICSTPGSESY